MKPMFRLDDKVALVTGAARGIGAATARTLARQGARIALADLDLDGAKAVAGSIENGAQAFGADLGKVEECKALVAAVVAHFGRLDILVNNAGICPVQPFGTATEAEWDTLMNVNARSQYFLMQAVCPVMKRQGGGRIINLSSAAGRVGSVLNASIYSGTKAAILMISKSIAREVAADGILVNCVAPGPIKTDIQRNLPVARLNAAREQVPLKRFGEPEEVAAAIAFLASDECSFCTGATLDVNGGWFML
jgi:NAD(P)-dependent dehydrogenase (short-subunit alcohol dehydrogenase family)